MSTDKLLNQPAPSFSLFDQENKQHQLSDYQGQWCVIYFYPKDDTPGCTKQACNLRDDYTVLQSLNISILGISLDNSATHAYFADKYQLPFPLLADQNGQVASAYQALFTLGPFKLAKRHSFLIDPAGIIRAIFRQVNTSQHTKQILEVFQQLR